MPNPPAAAPDAKPRTAPDAAHRASPYGAPGSLDIRAVPGLPLVAAGDDLAALIATACRRAAMDVRDNDVLVVAQKIVSKSEGRLVQLDDVTPGAEALALGTRTGKDPRVVELILAESNAVLRQAPGVIIVEHRCGFVMANAGIDQSNVPAGSVLLLPKDPDRSALTLKARCGALLGADLGIIISDSIGRAWRNGTIGHALGVAGMSAVCDLRGMPDLYGRQLQVSETALADNLAAAASILMGEACEGHPVVRIRGLHDLGERTQNGRSLLRDKSRDLFR
ncbi:MAG TPA: coenzyme F420-0:L-glutamate ligase [Woeseiaceae bacterium]|nr:coenzyme F420-0:L-glutamate ligase [Woeseiaceae bacterium]